jgi:hypothetical protein
MFGLKETVCGGSALTKSWWICIEDHMSSEKNQKRKNEMVRICGKNVRKKNFKEKCLRILRKENGLLESQERDD